MLNLIRNNGNLIQQNSRKGVYQAFYLFSLIDFVFRTYAFNILDGRLIFPSIVLLYAFNRLYFECYCCSLKFNIC